MMSVCSGLVVEDIRKRFEDTEVLRSVSLTAPEARITGLIGENGAGKSTLFKILMGLVAADAGKARLNGEDLLSLPLHKKSAAGLGYLPQESASFPELTVRDNLFALLEVLPIKKGDREGRLRELMQLTGIENLSSRLFRMLSRGEQRRLEMAKVLAARPRVLLLDEPFSGLDPRIVEELVDIFKRLVAGGIGILLTDHNIHMALDFVDHVYLLAGGIIVCSGSPAEIKRNEQARRLYLGDWFNT